MKKCSVCKVDKEETEFYKERRNRDGLATQCKKCSYEKQKEHRKLSPEKYKLAQFKQFIKWKYNLSWDEYQERLWKQDSRCAICGSYETENNRAKRLGLDHNHKTGQLRGFLCDSCNVGLARFKENKQILLNAISYLERWEK